MFCFISSKSHMPLADVIFECKGFLLGQICWCCQTCLLFRRQCPDKCFSKVCTGRAEKSVSTFILLWFFQGIQIHQGRVCRGGCSFAPGQVIGHRRRGSRRLRNGYGGGLHLVEGEDFEEIIHNLFVDSILLDYWIRFFLEIFSGEK